MPMDYEDEENNFPMMAKRKMMKMMNKVQDGKIKMPNLGNLMKR